MNPLTPYLLWIKIGAVVVLFFALAGYHHHVFEQGVTQERVRRDKIDAANTLKAKKELASINAKLKATQAELSTAIAVVAAREKELNDEKAASVVYQQRLAAGTERMRVLTIQRRTDQARPTDGASPAAVDQGTEVVADIDPKVASNLAGLTAEGDQAIIKLNACIQAYEAVEKASR